MIVAAEPLKAPDRGGKRYAVEQPPIVIGIDPGTRCGIAWRIGSQSMQVATKKLLDTMELLTTLVREHGIARTQIWIEDARQNKPAFHRKGASPAAMLKIAQNVGAVKRDTGLLEQHCQTLGVKPMMVRPTTAKWTPAMMRAATGITRCSQHARDAAKLIAGRGGR
jgi:RNA-splicing ligase RtcB